MRIPCVGAIVTDGQRRLLVVRRGRPPAAGAWSVPGGRVEPGESDLAALAREVREETGLDVEVGDLAGTVERAASDGAIYVIRDYRATVRGGTLRAGDDAVDVRWVDATELAALTLTEGLVEALTEWAALPPSTP